MRPSYSQHTAYIAYVPLHSLPQSYKYSRVFGFRPENISK